MRPERGGVRTTGGTLQAMLYCGGHPARNRAAISLATTSLIMMIIIR